LLRSSFVKSCGATKKHVALKQNKTTKQNHFQANRLSGAANNRPLSWMMFLGYVSLHINYCHTNALKKMFTLQVVSYQEATTQGTFLSFSTPVVGLFLLFIYLFIYLLELPLIRNCTISHPAWHSQRFTASQLMKVTTIHRLAHSFSLFSLTLLSPILSLVELLPCASQTPPFSLVLSAGR